MTRFLRSLSGKGWWLAAIGVGLMCGLAIALLMHRFGGSSGDTKSVMESATPADLRREVDAACMAFGIDKGGIRVRQDGTSPGEHRIVVDEAFRPLEFNYALSRRLAKWDVRVVGEERPREKKMTFRLMSEGKQMWSIIILIQNTERKEDRHRP